MLRPYVDTLQRITTDDGNEFTDLFQSTLRSELGLPGLQFLRIFKEGISQTHPGRLAQWKQQCAVYESIWKNTGVSTQIPIIPNQMGSITLCPPLTVQKTGVPPAALSE
jgi:hypothetical protein